MKQLTGVFLLTEQLQVQNISVSELHLLAEDGADGLLHLATLLDVHRPHVRLADVHLCVGMLGGQLQGRTEFELELRRVRDSLCVCSADVPALTSLRVGLPLKKSVFLLLFGGLNFGLRNAQPLAMASRGAGPS